MQAKENSGRRRQRHADARDQVYVCVCVSVFARPCFVEMHARESINDASANAMQLLPLLLHPPPTLTPSVREASASLSCCPFLVSLSLSPSFAVSCRSRSVRGSIARERERESGLKIAFVVLVLCLCFRRKCRVLCACPPPSPCVCLENVRHQTLFCMHHAFTCSSAMHPPSYLMPLLSDSLTTAAAAAAGKSVTVCPSTVYLSLFSACDMQRKGILEGKR